MSIRITTNGEPNAVEWMTSLTDQRPAYALISRVCSMEKSGQN